MNEMEKCSICNSTNMEPGTILSTGKLHFRPEHARFLKLKTANVEVTAHLCLDCGHISLTGDAERVKGLVAKRATALEPRKPQPLSVGVP